MTKQLRIVYDLDETLCTKRQSHETYADVQPIQPMIDQLNKFYDEGFEIIISTARNMVTQNNHVSKVIKNVGAITLEWLEKHNVKYHGIQFGKEYSSLYIDDKSCINDPNEIQRRIDAIKNGTEEEYLLQLKTLFDINNELQQKINELEEKLRKYEN